MNKKKTDEKLIEALKKDKERFGTVYNDYNKVVFNYLRSRTGNKAASEDLTSEVFLKAYRAIDDFKWQGISLSAWIFTIARNLLTDYYRKVGKIGESISLSEVESYLPSNETDLFTDIIRSEDERLLYDAIREFREKDQYLIYHKFFEGLSNKEIAVLIGQSESNVGTRLYRIRKKMRKILDKKIMNK